MTDSILDREGRQCRATIDKRDGSAHLWFCCTRPAGHRDTGHEFVGLFAGEHVHVVWGEPGSEGSDHDGSD